MRARIVGLVVAAFMALWVVPAGAVGSDEGMQSVCIDITVIVSPQPVVRFSRPYPCACGPALTEQPISGGVIYTVNTGCLEAPTA